MFYVLTKENCEWCDKAKFLLNKKGAPYGAFNYRTHPMFPLLMKKAGISTLPQIWVETPIGKEYIGGYDDLVDWFEHQRTDIDWID